METLYYNGIIRTMVSHIPEEALLVRDGRIAAVGEFGPLLEANPYVRKIDLQGRCLMPAFMDAHSHIVSWAMGKLQADLSEAKDFPAIAEAMAEFARRRGIAKGQWVIGFFPIILSWYSTPAAMVARSILLPSGFWDLHRVHWWRTPISRPRRRCPCRTWVH